MFSYRKMSCVNNVHTKHVIFSESHIPVSNMMNRATRVGVERNNDKNVASIKLDTAA